MGALDYALVTIAARYLLGEAVGPMRWAGVGLIVAGVAMTSVTM
jgi:drug/metabolite transporter (DMT)-like permease